MKHYDAYDDDAYDVTSRPLKAERWRWLDEHIEAHRLFEMTSTPLVPEPAPIVGREGGRVQVRSPTSRLMAERWRWLDEHMEAHRLMDRVLDKLADGHGSGRDLAHDRVEPHGEGERPVHAGLMVARARAALATVRRRMTTRRRQLFGCCR